MENQCKSINSKTGKRCTMLKDHFGPHRIGDQYHPIEEWIILCKDDPHSMDGKECNFHSNAQYINKGNKKITEFDQCIYCGYRKNIKLYKKEVSKNEM